MNERANWRSILDIPIKINDNRVITEEINNDNNNLGIVSFPIGKYNIITYAGITAKKEGITILL